MKKIAFICQPHYFRFTYEHDLDADFEVREFPFNFAMTEEDFEELKRFDADYNIFFRGEFFPESILCELRGIKINLSSEPFPKIVGDKWEFTPDSVRRYGEFRNIRHKSFDYVFHYDASSLELFKRDGMQIAGDFVLPVATGTYKAKEFKKEWDVFFIGRSTKHREDLFGMTKNHFNFLHVAHGISGEKLVEYINRSKICINAHAEDEISWEPRMQMMLACGAFVLSEKITPNRYLESDKHFVEFDGEKDLREKVGYYLENEAECKRISSNAAHVIVEKFDTRANFSKLIQGIENGIFKKFKIKGKDRANDYYLSAVPTKKDFLEGFKKIVDEEINYSEDTLFLLGKNDVKMMIEKKELERLEMEGMLRWREAELEMIRKSKFWRLRDAYCRIVDPMKRVMRDPSLLFVFAKNRIKKVPRIFLRYSLPITNFAFRVYYKKNPPQRVAMVCSTGAIGGAEKVFAKHVEFISSEFPVDAYFELAGGPVVEEVGKFSASTNVIKGFSEVALANHKYLYLVQSLPDLGLIKGLNPEIKVSLILHDPVLWTEEIRKRKSVIRHIDHIFCISKLIRNRLLEKIPELDARKVSVLYNSFSFGQENYEIEKNTSDRSSAFTWGYAGRFSFEKNVVEIIETFGRFQKIHPESRLIVAGDISLKDNKELQKYKKRIIELMQKTPGVEYWGYQSDLRRFYGEVDGIVMASFIEGISVAALDGLSYGIPVVSSDVGSMHEIIKDGENGILFPLDCPPFNPFDNQQLEFSQNDKNGFLAAMEKCWQTEWNHKQIATAAMDRYSAGSIKQEFIVAVKKLLAENKQ